MIARVLTDPNEAASELEEAERSAAITNLRSRVRPEQVQDANGNWKTEDCIDCGEPIGEGRLKLGKIRCIHCQTLLERQQRR